MWEDLIIKPFVNVLLLINSTFGSMGIAIILFTLLIRLVTHPLMVKQIKGAAKMQELTRDKRYIEMQAKYKNDKERLAQEQMKLYREMGVNPITSLGSSCLPLLIQLPIMIGLYQALVQTTVSTPLELHALSKFLYPWMHSISSIVPINSQFFWMDLGQPERLIIPGLSFGIPIIAILVLATSWLQSRVMQPPSDPNNPQAGMMGSMMNIYMPLLMGYMGLTLASGLGLYFIVGNIFSIGQYALLGKVNWANAIPFRKKPAPAVVVKSSSKPKRAELAAPSVIEGAEPAGMTAIEGAEPSVSAVSTGKPSGKTASKITPKPGKANLTKSVKPGKPKPR